MKKLFSTIGSFFDKFLTGLRTIEKVTKTVSAGLRHANSFNKERKRIWEDNSDEGETLSETIEDIVEEVDEIKEEIEDLKEGDK